MLPVVCDERLELTLEPVWGHGREFQPNIRPTALFNCALWVVTLKAIVTVLSDREDWALGGEGAWFVEPTSDFDDALVFARSEGEADDLCGNLKAIRRRWNQTIVAMNMALITRSQPLQNSPALYQHTYMVSGSMGGCVGVKWTYNTEEKNLLKIAVYINKLETICRCKLFIGRRGKFFCYNPPTGTCEWRNLVVCGTGVDSFESLLSLDAVCPNGAGILG